MKHTCHSFCRMIWSTYAALLYCSLICLFALLSYISPCAVILYLCLHCSLTSLIELFYTVTCRLALRLKVSHKLAWLQLILIYKGFLLYCPVESSILHNKLTMLSLVSIYHILSPYVDQYKYCIRSPSLHPIETIFTHNMPIWSTLHCPIIF